MINRFGGHDGFKSRVELGGNAGQSIARHDRVVRGDGLARAAGDDQLLPDSQQVAVRQVIDSQDFLDGYAEIGGNDGQIFAVLHHVDARDSRGGRVGCGAFRSRRGQGWRRQQRRLNRLGQQPEWSGEGGHDQSHQYDEQKRATIIHRQSPILPDDKQLAN